MPGLPPSPFAPITWLTLLYSAFIALLTSPLPIQPLSKVCVTTQQEQQQALSTENAEPNKAYTNKPSNARGAWNVIVSRVCTHMNASPNDVVYLFEVILVYLSVGLHREGRYHTFGIGIDVSQGCCIEKALLC